MSNPDGHRPQDHGQAGYGQASAQPGYGPPVPSWPPGYGPQAAYDPPGHAQPGYGAPGYGAPGYAASGYGPQNPYGPGYGPPAYSPPGYGPPGYGPGPGQPAYGGVDPTDVVGTRVGQYLLDGLLTAVPTIVLLLVVGGIVAASTDPDTIVAVAVGGYLVAILVGLAAGFVVHAYWPSAHQGQTPGMAWLKLRIVREEDGGVPSLGQCVVRWLLLVVDAFAGIVGLIVMSTAARHQRVGDMAARTLVVRA